ncbi:hypothetical protein UFOVP257_7 [uncultured Caudovirales phage]|uniref:Uncharacterized protein n=1 Tax=uncultured Caudovirales phage TaxID=2100421 RepID=A0A6J5LI96_9CAUD|nr:hypothetical protein UFOVP257_7 [uncultured Caudovirales phage]
MAIGRISGPMLFSNLERQGYNLAFESNLLYLDVNNFRVGVINSSPQYAFDSSGNAKLANIIIQGNSITSNVGKVDFGSTSNFTISGGSPNYVLSTDGAGNVSWNEISSLDNQWGNIVLANNTISITNTNGNLNLQANGTGNVVTTNDFYAGNVYALNIVGSVSSNGGSFTGNVSSPYFLGNLVGGNVTANAAIIITGNAATWYATNLNSTNGNVTTLVTNNFSTGNAVISGGYISGLSNITVTTGNVSSWYATTLNATSANITTESVANFSTANAVITGGYVNGLSNLTATTTQTTNFSTGNAVISGGYISALSNITATTGNVESWYAANLNSTNGNITTLVATNFSTANAQITGGNVTANITGNVTGTFGNFSGNVNTNWFIGNIDGAKANFLDVVFANSNLTVAGNLIASGNIISRSITSPLGDLHISAATNDPNNIIRFDSVSAFDIPAGRTDQRPPNPDFGYVRYNTEQGSIEWWSGSSWVQGAQTVVSENITPDGITDTYTLNQATTETAILVNINGTIQQAGSGAYSVVNDQITFAEIPLTTDIIEIRYLAGGVATASVNFESINSNVSPSANVTYSLGSPLKRWKDLWLSGTTIYIGAANISTVGSNVVITNPSGGSFTVSGSESGNATATFGNVYSKAFYFANGTPFTSSTFGNTEVAAYLLANPQGNFYSNANVTAYIPQDATILAMQANITAANLWIGNAAGQAGELQTLTANAASQASSLTTLISNAASQADSLTTLISNAASQQTSINTVNANVGAYQTYANANVVAIQANLGSYQTYANANVVAIQANLGAYQTYANSNAAIQQANITSLRARAFTSVMVFGG